ncbi:UxaA family hydrolase [Alsobacter sp. R-9]
MATQTGAGDAWNAVVIHETDNVGVALTNLSPGPVRVRRGSETIAVSVREPVPLGHKFALSDIPAGATILKYGEVIGSATRPIEAGAHVHVHNLASRRARGGAAP